MCKACRRAEARAAYAELSLAERKARGRRANEQARKRRQKLEEKIVAVKKAIPLKHDLWDDQELDIVPFRMWVLGQIRDRGGVLQDFADDIGYDKEQVRRWANGYYWAEAGCDPMPIRSVRLSTVDEVAIAANDPGLLDRLYPWVDPEP